MRKIYNPFGMKIRGLPGRTLMKRLEMFMLSAIFGGGLLVIGCGGGSESDEAASTEQPAAAETAAAETPEAEAEEAPPQERRTYAPPVRGTANIEILQPETKVEGNEVITRIQVRNVSSGAILMLRVDENWYDKDGNNLPGVTERWRQPLQPNEVIEMVLRVPKNPDYYQNNFQFTHQNGDVQVKTVEAFPEVEEEASEE
jgi:hypothetical protein